MGWTGLDLTGWNLVLTNARCYGSGRIIKNSNTTLVTAGWMAALQGGI